MTLVDGAVAEIMLAAKDEAAAAALSEGPDSKMEQEKVVEEKQEKVEEDEAPAKNKADVKEAEDRDGIYASFF